MRSQLLVLVVLVLLFYVPPVRSEQNAYINRIFGSCWRIKGSCRKKCVGKELFHILCDTSLVCCIESSELPMMSAVKD
ncbi:beta-defensin 135 [Sciurus carolinensis]|uniref:beta-defensin 135 n=1 Tax=Sciurus carolinensis TaxID=30640 RepID=UPI001FB3C8CA|nr:beta-defensin 135 [Sciurus carolinensis]